MANVFDVDASALIKRASEQLKAKGVSKPAYVDYVKSGASRERVPMDADFFYMRSASVLRQVYINGPIGISKLRTRYGTRKMHSIHRHHHMRAGGSVIKDAFSALEKLNYVKKTPKGREITPAGKSFMDKLSNELLASSGA
ncbi:MAG: 30S ribosomal protein S19e [Candidatus Micrarchaeota archaeon]|nr:30S ribosomal protein S19e [Candidatus Micrarchaeota archaeon]MDE1804876.1 30S ribosomal protein S19e [Candidatus Micrarchaeota archaeon]MDE1847162.1 30S ribosomal protein S19e [Candidatus Micrarchaeota archaeon]